MIVIVCREPRVETLGFESILLSGGNNDEEVIDKKNLESKNENHGCADFVVVCHTS